MATTRISLDELQPIKVKLADLSPVQPQAQAEQPWQHKPVISLESIKLDPSKTGNAFGQFAAGLQRGGVSTFEEFTTPQNIGIMGAVAGASLIPGVGELVAPAAGLYFGYEMLKGALEQAPEAYEAWKAGRYGEAGELVSRAGLGAMFAKAGVKHGLQRPLAARMSKPWEPGGIRPVPKVGPQTPAIEGPTKVPLSELTPAEPVRKGLAKTAAESAEVLAPLGPSPPFKPAAESAQVFIAEPARLRAQAEEIRQRVRISGMKPESKEFQLARAAELERQAADMEIPPPPKVEPATPLTSEISSGTVPSEVANAPRVDPEKSVGRAGEGEVRPVLEPRPPSGPIWTGQSGFLDIPGGAPVPIEYELRELGDIAASHLGETFQPNSRFQHKNPRNYEDPANQASVLEGSGPKHNPYRLVTDNPTATNGPSVIDPNGNVLGGNSRIMMLERLYASTSGIVDRYKQALREKLSQFGIDPKHVDEMKQPVLVRKLKEIPADVDQALIDLNKKETKDYTPAERAIADSKMMTPKILDYLQGLIESAGPEATFNDVVSGANGIDIINRFVDSGIFTTEERGSLIDKNTKGITPAGRVRIAEMLTGQLFRDSEQLARTPQEMKNKLERIVAPLSRLRGTGEWDLKPVVEEALDFMEEMRVRGAKRQEVSKTDGPGSVKAAIAGGFITPEEGKGMVVSKGKLKGQLTEKAKTLIEDRMRQRQEQELILGQGTMFEGPAYSPDAVTFARFLQRKPTDIAVGVKDFAIAADQTLNPTASMFEPMPRNEAFKQSFADPPKEGPKGAPKERKGKFGSQRGSLEVDQADVERMREILEEQARNTRLVQSRQQQRDPEKIGPPPSLFGAEAEASSRSEFVSDRARLEGERLSAEFASPLNRSNLRKKLKPGEQPVQIGMFEPPPEPRRQANLFTEEKRLPPRFPGGFWAKPGGEMIPLEALASHQEMPLPGGAPGALKRGYVRGRGAGVEIHSISAADPEALRNGLREASRHGDEIWVDQIGGSSLYRADELRDAGWDINQVRPIQRLGAGERGSFSLTPSEAKPPRPPDRQAEWFNFRRMRFSSDAEELQFRRSLDEAVDQYHLDPKQVEPHAAVIEAARSIDPELVKDVEVQADAGIMNRAARYAMKQRIGTLKQLLGHKETGLYRQINDAKSAGVPEAERIELERKASAMEQDLQNYLGKWAGIRTMDGRNLAMHNVMADSTWDLSIWATKARRALALPPDVNLPEPVLQKIIKGVASGEEAQNVIEAAVPPEIRTELATAKTTLQQAETRAIKAQATAEEVAKVREQTDKARETRMQAQRVLSESKRELYAARQAYQRVVEKREQLLSGNPRVKAATEQLKVAKRNLAKELQSLQRTSWTEMLSLVWRTSLFGVKSHARNIVATGAFQKAEEVSLSPGSIADVAMALGTKRRTLPGPSLRAVTDSIHHAATEGWKGAMDIMRHGVRPEEASHAEARGEMNFQGLGKYSDLLNRYVNYGMIRSLTAEDYIWKSYATRRSLWNQAKVTAINEARQGTLPDAEILKRTEWLVRHPTAVMSAEAALHAEIVTFNSKNKAAQFLSRGSTVLGPGGKMVVDFTLPFKRTPANLFSMAFRYNPAAPLYTIAKAGIEAKRTATEYLSEPRQKAIAESVGRGATGTAVMLLGYWMGQQLLATGPTPSTEGQRNVRGVLRMPTKAIKLGEDWMRLTGLEPIGSLFTAGASIALNEKIKSIRNLSGGTRAFLATLPATAQQILESPFLTGPNNIYEAIEATARSFGSGGKLLPAAVESFGESYGRTVVPTAVADLSTVIDPKQREFQGPLEAIQNRVPFWRSQLPEKTDILGMPLGGRRSAAWNIFMPQAAANKNDPLIAELQSTEIGIGDPSRRPEEPEAEFRARRDFVGKLMELELRSTINSTDYWAAAPEEKKQLLDSAVRRARAQMSEYTTQDEDYQAENPGERVKRLRGYIEKVENEHLTPIRGQTQIPPVPAVQ